MSDLPSSEQAVLDVLDHLPASVPELRRRIHAVGRATYPANTYSHIISSVRTLVARGLAERVESAGYVRSGTTHTGVS